MDALNLLERMASISPGVRFHLEGRLWQINVDEDEITHQILINECFAVVITEAYELGIEFYCTLGDLAESLYTINKTLLLFEVIFPTPLYKSITESDAFKMMISAVVLDGVSMEGESSIETILHHLAMINENTKSIFIDTYQFLEDKMKSTPVFDNYVTSTLNIDNTPFAEIVVDETIKDYLTYVQNTFSKLLKITDLLSSKLDSKENLSTLYDDILTYKVKSIDESTLTAYSWAFEHKDLTDQTPNVQILIEKYKTQFCASVPFYEEFFILRGDIILPNNIVTLVLGTYLETKTKEAFLSKVSEVFDRLQANGKFITNQMVSLTQSICLILVQEYY